MTVRHRMAGLALAFAAAWALTIPHATVVRAEDGGGRLSFGDDVAIEAGETVSGNVVLMGADLTVEPGATVDGDVAVTFGDAAIDGKVTGQVFVAGDLTLGPTAEIGGDVVVLGQDTIADAALVHGRVTRGGDRLGVGGVTEEPPAAGPSSLSRLGRVLASTALAMLIAALVVTVAPVAVSRVATAMTTRSAASFGVGCLAWVLFLPLAVALTITVVGVLALGLFYFLALLVGAVAVAEIFGAAVAPGSRRASRAALGAAALGLALNVGTTEHLGLLCASAAVAVLASVWPLGAGILTLVGTRPWPPEDAQPWQEGGEAPSPWAPTRQAKAGAAAAEEPSPAEEAPPTVSRTPEASALPAPTVALPAPEAPAPDLSRSPDASAEGEDEHAPPPEEGPPAEGPPPGTVEPPGAPEAPEVGGVLGKVADASGAPAPSQAEGPVGGGADSAAGSGGGGASSGPELTSVPGITAVYAALLTEAGIGGLHDLAAADAEAVAAAVSVPGVLPVTREIAASWVRAAADLTQSLG